jgi:twitching motility protein PilT
MSVTINDLLRRAVERGASDLHLKASTHPCLRINGVLEPQTDLARLTPEDTVLMALSMMSSRQKESFTEGSELDIAYGPSGIGRFRVCVFRGLIPVTGATGSGKSSTLAAMVDRINSRRSEHIITIENPIECLHRDKKCFINQREVGLDTPTFAVALRAALRQDPDIVLVGEMRDLETISTTLLAAETGHLVLSTLHTLDATETIQRIITVFPAHEQKVVRLQLASALHAVVSQRLVPRADGTGRVPVVEVMVSTTFIRDCIVNPDKTRLIHGAIAEGGSEYGIQTFDQSLYGLYSQELITQEEALLHASNPDDLRLRMQGVRSASDAQHDEMSTAFERTLS